MTETTVQLETVVSDDPAIARSFATALLSIREWIHRRVETVTFIDAHTIRRTTSLDFTVVPTLPRIPTGDGEAVLVPLSYLAKHPVTSLDVRDETGAAVSVLTTEQNGALSAAALVAIAAAFVQQPQTPNAVDLDDFDRLPEAIGEITVAPIPLAEAKYRALETFLAEEVGPEDALATLAATPEFLERVATFVSSFVLVAVLPATIGQRRIVKFGYEEPARGQPDERGRGERLLDGLGVTPTTIRIPIPAADVATSFHLEIRAPEGVGMTESVLYDAVRQPRSSVPWRRQGRRVVHVLAPRDPGPACEVKVNLRASPGGWLRSSLATVAAVALVMTLSATRLGVVVDAPRGQPARPSGDVAALLLAVVGVVVALIVRPGEHPLTTHMLTWARAVTMAGVALPLVGAWLLAFGPRGTLLTVLWWVLAIVGWVATVVLAITYRGPNRVMTQHQDEAPATLSPGARP